MPFSPSVRLTVLATACLAATPAFADLKTDGEWRGSGGLALSSTSGNSTSTALALNADMVRATTADKITLGASANYARSKANGTTSTTSNKWASAGQYDYNLSSQLFAFGKLGLEGDALTELTLRSTLAAGLGFKLIDSKETTLNLFGGAAYTTDRYDTAQTIGSRVSKTFSRSSLLLGEESTHQLASNTSFKQRLELYPGLSGDKAFLSKFSASLTVAVSSALNVSFGLQNSTNSKPPQGTQKNDLGLFTGVSVRFGAP
jgi:putative salt-induced outer membrane protein